MLISTDERNPDSTHPRGPVEKRQNGMAADGSVPMKDLGIAGPEEPVKKKARENQKVPNQSPRLRKHALGQG